MACARLDTSDILEDGKNLKQVEYRCFGSRKYFFFNQIVCPRCGSKILPPKMGTYEVDLKKIFLLFSNHN